MLTKIGVALVPVALTAAIPLVWAISGNIGETRGFKSRDQEVADYTLTIANLKQDLLNCTSELDDAKHDVLNLNKKMGAQAEASANALRAQSATVRAAQAATNKAMELLAKKGDSRDAYFSTLTGQLKGLKYETDENGTCIVRGGANVLRNAAKGKK